MFIHFTNSSTLLDKLVDFVEQTRRLCKMVCLALPSVSHWNTMSISLKYNEQLIEILGVSPCNAVAWAVSWMGDSIMSVCPLTRAYNIYKVCWVGWFDINQNRRIFSVFSWIFPWKVLVVPEKVVPLHPLTRKRPPRRLKERVLWKISIDRSSTRSDIFYDMLGIRNKPFNSWEYWIVVLRQINVGREILQGS